MRVLRTPTDAAIFNGNFAARRHLLDRALVDVVDGALWAVADVERLAGTRLWKKYRIRRPRCLKGKAEAFV